MTPGASALLVLLVAGAFYAAIPGAGAFIARGRWRRFRARIASSSLLPTVEYTHLSEAREHGSLRFLGRLEAMQGENTIWVTNGHFSVEADLANVLVYLLPSPQDTAETGPDHGTAEHVPDEIPQDIPWKRIFSLPQGMQILLAGPFTAEKGRGTFRSQDRERLLVVIFDGDAATLLPRAILGGRQRNEYWNQYTLVSLVLGCFVLLLSSYLLLQNAYNRIPALLAITAAVFPISALLPPGVLLYLPYRQLWQRARRLRAERDLLRLPLRHFQGAKEETETRLPDGERYGVRVGANTRCLENPLIRLPVHVETRPVSPDASGYRTYGALGHDELGEYLTRPQDTLAELVRIPGDPAELARECAHRARLLELLAGLLIAADVLINLFLVLLGLGRLVP